MSRQNAPRAASPEAALFPLVAFPGLALVAALNVALAASACTRTHTGPGAGAAASPPVASAPAATAARAAIRPAPGADILADPPPPEAGVPAPPKGRTVEPLDLDADRPLVKVSLPSPPAGGNAAFALADGRRGWVTKLPSGVTIPTAAWGDGRVYVSGGFETHSFYALDDRSGHIEWSRHTLADDGPTAPLYSDGQVVFNTESCTLFVLDAKTGKERWRRWLGDPTLAQVAVSAGLVFAAYPTGGGGQRLGAFRLADGRPVWSRPIAGEVLSTPVVAGDSVFVTTVRGATHAFRLEDGDPVWTTRHGASSAPWPLGGELFLSRTEKGEELQVVLDAATGRTLRTLRALPAPWARDVPRSIAPSWKHVWAFEGSRPVVIAGRRFDTMGGEIHASDPASGAPLWVRRYAAGTGKRRLTAPAVAGAQIFFSTHDGALYALDVDTGMTVWAYDLPVRTVFQPIVARGWVYLTTTTGQVIGLSLADETLDGWHNWGGDPGHAGLAI